MSGRGQLFADAGVDEGVDLADLGRHFFDGSQDAFQKDFLKVFFEQIGARQVREVEHQASDVRRDDAEQIGVADGF